MLSLDKSDSINDDSEKDRSDSGSSGMHYFTTFSLHFDDTVGRVSGLRSEIVLLTGVNSKCDIFAFFLFASTGVEPKGG